MPTHQTEEAASLLDAALAPFRNVPYPRLCGLVGHTRASETAGPSGRRYRLECFVGRVHSREEAVTVSAIASEVREGGWLPRQVAAGFCMLSDGSIR